MVTTQVATGEVYLLGGRYGWTSFGVAKFDVSTNTFTRLTNMNKQRDNSACTVFKSDKHGGREVIYVGGGTSGNKASILDYTMTETWEEGNFYNLQDQKVFQMQNAFDFQITYLVTVQ